MIFTSIDFLVFFVIVFVLYFLFTGRYRWIILLAASYFFYGSYKLDFLPLLIIPTGIIYLIAIKISGTDPGSNRKWYLIVGIGTGIVGLVGFKYLDFLGSALFDLAGLFVDGLKYKPLDLLFPIGISFYSFKLVSYLLDVYNGKLEAERHLGYFALYVSFFPQLLAGPIDRAVNFIPELKKKVNFDYQRVMDGFKRVAWGLFKKLVIADRLAMTVDTVYSDVTAYTGPALILATLFYSIQIYCDFSGYSDIAIGISQVLGFKSMENFNSPYFSKNIAKFWSRWHISLSTWLRDYLFLPIAYAVMRRIKTERLLKMKTEAWGYVVGMFITMFLGGLWHGARWTLILWGVYHGLYLVISYSTKRTRKKIVKKIGLKKFPKFHRFFKIFITFHLVSFGWIFFRANTIQDAFYVYSNLFIDFIDFTKEVLGNLIFNLQLTPILQLIGKMGIKTFDFSVAILSIFILGRFDWAYQDKDFLSGFKDRPVFFRFTIYYLLIMGILLFAVYEGEQFIYFEF